jgi:hypothetical protein
VAQRSVPHGGLMRLAGVDTQPDQAGEARFPRVVRPLTGLLT